MSSTKYDFDARIDRRGTACEKWDDMGHLFGDDDLLALWVADMDFKSAPEIIDALKKKVEFGVFGYPTDQMHGYQTAVADWECRRHGWNVIPGQIGFMPGVITGIAVALNEFTEPGDGVVVQTPAYPPFFREIRRNGRIVVENPLREAENGYEMDLDHLAGVLDGVRAIVLCSPHNPVSRVWRREELTALGSLCLERRIVVISDEIHQDLVYSNAKHIPMSAACPELDPLLVTLIAPSKTFNIAGLRTSAWIARDKKMHDGMNRAFERLHLSKLNMLGLCALESAYTKGESWLDAVLAYLEENRELVENFLRERMPRVKLKHPEGTYVFWLDFRDYGLSSKQLMEILINKARVALNDGSKFGVAGEGFARLNAGCPRSQLQEGLERIAEAFADV